MNQLAASFWESPDDGAENPTRDGKVWSFLSAVEANNLVLLQKLFLKSVVLPQPPSSCPAQQQTRATWFSSSGHEDSHVFLLVGEMLQLWR